MQMAGSDIQSTVDELEASFGLGEALSEKDKARFSPLAKKTMNEGEVKEASAKKGGNIQSGASSDEALSLLLRVRAAHIRAVKRGDVHYGLPDRL
jgi:hypothetical protein